MKKGDMVVFALSSTPSTLSQILEITPSYIKVQNISHEDTNIIGLFRPHLYRKATTKEIIDIIAFQLRFQLIDNYVEGL